MELFPLNAGLSQTRSIVRLIKEKKGGAIEVSKIAHETKKSIDTLFPLIDACRILGLCTIQDGIIKITPLGDSITPKTFAPVMARELVKVEPFKSIVQLLHEHEKLTSRQLADQLSEKGITFYHEAETNAELLKSMLLRWGIRNKLLSYDFATDLWSSRV
ncbi:MAG TPA: AAA-associated domain-containing protein [Candidatus Baltobacteraceae bacterium]|nr:AAA-associated domain-containing protein [Candidatus Baltobacteraceae bacterium]